LLTRLLLPAHTARPGQDTLLRGTSANPREVVLCCMAYACNVIDNVLNKLEDHRQEIAEEKLQRFLNSWPQVRSHWERGNSLISVTDPCVQAAADRDPANEALASLVRTFVPASTHVDADDSCDVMCVVD
jgi:hypothetical protein